MKMPCPDAASEAEATPPGPSSPAGAPYDREAADYDKLRFETVGGRLSNELDNALAAFALRPGPGKRILDVPVGTGRTALALAAAGAEIEGVDVSAGMLEQARRKIEAAGCARIHLHKVDARDLPFPDGHFDGISSLRLFHLLRPAEMPAFLSEFHRVLKPGGVLFVEFPRRFYAAGVAWVLRKTIKRRPKGYIPLGARRRLFGSFTLVRVLGGYFPYMRLLAALSYRAALRASLAIARSPVRVLTRQAFVVLQKQPGPDGNTAGPPGRNARSDGGQAPSGTLDGV